MLYRPVPRGARRFAGRPGVLKTVLLSWTSFNQQLTRGVHPRRKRWQTGPQIRRTARQRKTSLSSKVAHKTPVRNLFDLKVALKNTCLLSVSSNPSSIWKSFKIWRQIGSLTLQKINIHLSTTRTRKTEAFSQVESKTKNNVLSKSKKLNRKQRNYSLQHKLISSKECWKHLWKTQWRQEWYQKTPVNCIPSEIKKWLNETTSLHSNQKLDSKKSHHLWSHSFIEQKDSIHAVDPGTGHPK